jgi:hypothetical protein
VTADATIGFWEKARVILPVALVQSAAYTGLNHSPEAACHRLPLTALDEAIPFLPWTVWGYLLLLGLSVALPFLIRRRGVFRRTVLAYGAAVPAAFLVFLIWPTAYPRPCWAPDGTWSGWAYGWLIRLDTPECAFPSGHVLVPAISAWGVYRDGRWYGPWVLGLTLALSPTILTTKQHYLWDLLGGLALAAAGVLWAERLAPRWEGPNGRPQPGGG